MAAAALAAGGMGALGVGVGMGSRGVVGVDAALAPLAQLARLFVASALPVLKVAMLCGAGALASAQGLLSPEGRRVLSGLSFRVFTPCLMFAKLGPSVGISETLQLWPLSVNMVMSHVVGLLLGAALVRLVAVPRRLAPHLVLAAGVGNVGNLPFVVVAGLAADPSLPFAAALGPAAAVELGLRYVALSNLTASLIQFPLTFLGLDPKRNNPWLLHHHEGAGKAAGPASGSATSSSSDSLGAGRGAGGGAGAASGSGRDNGPAAGTALPASVDPRTMPAVSDDPSHGAAAAASTQAASTSNTPAAAAAASAASTPGSGGSPGGGQQQQQQQQQAWAASWWQRTSSALSGLLTPPTWACLLALLVASVPALRDAVFVRGGALHLVGEVADMLGAMTIPSLLMVLGANLARGPGVAAGRLPAAAVAAACACRLVAMPLLGSAIVMAAHAAGWLAGTDGLALLVMLLMHATPTAVLVHSMSSIHQNCEDEAAALLFYQYAACLLTLPLAISAMLRLVAHVPLVVAAA